MCVSPRAPTLPRPRRAKVQKLIFSSSCATFGAPTSFPITERTPQRPTNPYGAAKLQASGSK